MNAKVMLAGAVMTPLLVAFAAAEGTAEWPRFRGPNGSGLDESAAVPAEWNDASRLWSVKIPGVGQGSPVVRGNRLYLLSAVPVADPAENGKSGKKKRRGAEPHEWLTFCLDRATGETVWKRRFEQRPFKGHRFNSAASSTPAVDEERVVFAWGTAERLNVAALSHDGDLLWETDLGPVAGGHGFGGSPILHDELVVLNNDQNGGKGNLVALDAATGEVDWTVERRSQRISYSVPCVYEADGRELLMFVNWQHGFTAVDPADGSVAAEKSVFDTETNERAISSPIVSQGLVIGTCGFTANPKHCVAVRWNGEGLEEVWRLERNIPHVPSVIAVGDHTFLIDDAGIGTCLETATGQVRWRERLPGVQGKVFGSPVSDGRHIFFLDESGNAHAIAAEPKFRSVAVSPLGGTARATPALVDGIAYVRVGSTLSAFGER